MISIPVRVGIFLLSKCIMYFSTQISFKISFQFNASYLLENATIHVYATRLVAVFAFWFLFFFKLHSFVFHNKTQATSELTVKFSVELAPLQMYSVQQ